MITEIQNGLSALKDLKGVRNILWALLIAGLFLIFFESLSQYFSVSALQAKAELLGTLDTIESTEANKQKIAALHSNLIEETKRVFSLIENPTSYLMEKILRFFQGAYLSLPIFLLVFKGLTFVYRKAEDHLKQMTLMLSSLIFSAAVWMTTILGVVSVLWNKSDNLLVSWVLFPVSSSAILLIFVVWLVSLRIFLMREKQSKEQPDEIP